MKKIRIYDWISDIRNILGLGIRAVVWVQGCSLHCEGCIAPEMWPKDDGKSMAVSYLAQLILSSGHIDGITVSGGEPTEQAEAVGMLLATIKKAGKNTWVYSGYTLEELISRNDPATDYLLAHTDVIVDGRFKKAEAGIYTFRGSANQRIIELPEGQTLNVSPVKEKSYVEITLGGNDRMVVIGIPPPGFLDELKATLSNKGVQVDYTKAKYDRNLLRRLVP